MSAAVSPWPAPLRPRVKHSSPLRHATPSVEAVRRPTSRKPSLLATAAATWHPHQPAEITALLASGASVHQQDTKGNTCLHLLLASAHPNQHWVGLSLTTLLRAGADPSKADGVGRTAFGIACDAPPTHGSFRRDLLLQALLESDKEIPDSRLFAPTRLTNVYTQIRHEILFNDVSPQAESQLREELLQRITEAMEQRETLTDTRLHSAALDRTMSSYSVGSFVDRETIFKHTFRYLKLMCLGKKAIVRMCKTRFSKVTSVELGEELNLLQMAQNANTSALLEFDWWRPVDEEDLFSTYVDFMIEQLEGVKAKTRDEEMTEKIEGLIDMLQNAVPSYRTCSLKGRQCGSSQSGEEEVRPPDSGIDFPTVEAPELSDKASDEMSDLESEQGYETYRDWLTQPDAVESAEEKARKASIVKTPVEFYAKKPWESEDEMPYVMT